MFSNLDKKMKAFGWIAFIAGLAVSVLAAIPYLEDDAIIAIAIIAGGFLVSWLAAIPYFVFHQLLVNTGSKGNGTVSGGKTAETIKAPVHENAAFAVKKELRKVSLEKKAGAAEISKADFIKNALEYRIDEGLLYYTQSNYCRLNDEDKKSLAGIVTLIEHNEPDELRNKLKELA